MYNIHVHCIHACASFVADTMTCPINNEEIFDEVVPDNGLVKRREHLWLQLCQLTQANKDSVKMGILVVYMPHQSLEVKYISLCGSLKSISGYKLKYTSPSTDNSQCTVYQRLDEVLGKHSGYI